MHSTCSLRRKFDIIRDKKLDKNWTQTRQKLDKNLTKTGQKLDKNLTKTWHFI